MSFTVKLWRVLSSKALNLLIGIAGLVIGVYGIWFYHPRPALVFDTLSDTKVLDVHAPLGKLDIVYAGESLKATSRELRLIVIRISNTGNADIGKDSFDADNPLGLRVSSGTLLEPPAISASNEYLNKSVRALISGTDSVSLKPMILESGEWIELKLLIAVPAGIVPEIAPMGKIAGVKRISTADTASERLSKPLWSRLVGADAFWIQVVRLPIYFVGLIIFLASIFIVGLVGFFISIYPVQELNSLLKKRRRRKIVETYSKTKELRPTDHVVVDEYLENGSTAIPLIRNYIEGVERHNSETEERKSILDHLSSKFEPETIRRMTRLRKPRVPRGFQEVTRRGLQSEKDGILSIDPDLARAVEDFDRFLRVHGEVPPEQTSFEQTVDMEDVPEHIRVQVLRDFDTSFDNPFAKHEYDSEREGRLAQP